VASYRTEVFRDYPAFNDWPHIEGGTIRINPVYTEQSRDSSGNIFLRRVFPSPWYEQENGSEDGRFVPESAVVSSQAMEDLAHGKLTVEIEKLIEQGVVLGFPELHGKASIKVGAF